VYYTVSEYSSPISSSVLMIDRQFQVIWGDRWTNILKIGSSVVNALVTGSLLYDQQNTSATMLTKPGALFFPILLFCLAAMSETTASFLGRPIVSRHQRFSFYRPTAFIFANIATDIAWMTVLFTLFFIPFYFIVHLQFNAARFFTAWFVYLLITLCLTSFYRMIGAWNKHFGIASQISGWCTMVMMVYTGESIRILRPALLIYLRVSHLLQRNACLVPMDRLY
jgi:ABC-type multidrug transport system permease subunit